jgi:hypothetical protein
MFRIKLDEGEGEFEIDTDPVVVKQWELQSKTRLSLLDKVGIGQTEAIFLAWKQRTRDGATTLPLADYEDRLKVCKFVEPEEAEDHPSRPI